MKKLLFLTLLLSISISWGQKKMSSLDKNTSTFISKLETRGVSSYFTTDRYCNGNSGKDVKSKDACESKVKYLARYVFWKENGATMVKLIDNCGMYTSYVYKDIALIDFYEANLNEFKSNKLKPYTPEVNNVVAVRRSGPDNCRRDFMFKGSSGAFLVYYNMFDLTSNAAAVNVNAGYNNALPIVKLDKMIDEAITTMEANRGWKRM